jgi:hypothetical protein
LALIEAIIVAGGTLLVCGSMLADALLESEEE